MTQILPGSMHEGEPVLCPRCGQASIFQTMLGSTRCPACNMTVVMGNEPVNGDFLFVPEAPEGYAYALQVVLVRDHSWFCRSCGRDLGDIHSERCLIVPLSESERPVTEGDCIEREEES